MALPPPQRRIHAVVIRWRTVAKVRAAKVRGAHVGVGGEGTRVSGRRVGASAADAPRGGVAAARDARTGRRDGAVLRTWRGDMLSWA
eukprot:4883376-Prymnesium_polylepis.1